MISNFENIKSILLALYTRSPVRIMPLNSAFPALLFRNFCPPVLGGFSRYSEGSRGLSLLQPCCRLSVADGRAPISHTLEGLRACSRQGGIREARPLSWCCIMSRNCAGDFRPEGLAENPPGLLSLPLSFLLLTQRYGEYLKPQNLFSKM